MRPIHLFTYLSHPIKNIRGHHKSTNGHWPQKTIRYWIEKKTLQKCCCSQKEHRLFAVGPSLLILGHSAGAHHTRQLKNKITIIHLRTMIFYTQVASLCFRLLGYCNLLLCGYTVYNRKTDIYTYIILYYQPYLKISQTKTKQETNVTYVYSVDKMKSWEVF